MRFTEVFNKTNTLVILGEVDGYTATLGPNQSITLSDEQISRNSRTHNTIQSMINRGLLQILKPDAATPVVAPAKKGTGNESVSFIKDPEIPVDDAAISAISGGPDSVELEDAGQVLVKTGKRKAELIPVIAAVEEKPKPKSKVLKGGTAVVANLNNDIDEEDDNDFSGSIIKESPLPGRSTLVNIDQLNDEARTKLAQDTSKVLEQAARDRKFVQIMTNWAGYNPAQKSQFIKNTNDMAILNAIIGWEKSSQLVGMAKARSKAVKAGNTDE